MATTSQIVDITPLAAQKLKDALQEQGQAGALLRVMPMPGPNGGFQYAMSIEEEAKDDDFVMDIENLTVLVDSESAPLVEGAQIDYIEGLMRSGFVISNPNVEFAGGGCGGGGCGCGGGGCGCGGGGGGWRLRMRRRWWRLRVWRRRSLDTSIDPLLQDSLRDGTTSIVPSLR